MFDPIILLKVLWIMESGLQHNPANGKDGEVGPYQITQACLQDVNDFRGTRLTLEDCRKLSVARWVVISYLERWNAVYDYESACRTWNGGPNGMYKEATLAYWNRCKNLIKMLENDRDGK